MFLIVGPRPAGTGAVAAALDAHPDLLVVGSGDLLVPLAFLLERVPDPDVARRLAADLVVASREFPEGIGRHLDPAAVHVALDGVPVRLGALLAALYGAVADAAGVTAAGTVLSRMGMAVLTRTGLHEAGIPYVHVVRDIRSMVAARLVGGDDPESAARKWTTQNGLFRRRWGTDPARYQVLRYEDLVADPVAAVRRVGRFLGAPGEPTAVAAPAPDPDVTPLSPEVRASISRVAADGLYDFGYDPPVGSPRRLAVTLQRRSAALVDRGRRRARSLADRAWVWRTPPPGRASRGDDDLAPAWCNVCRWSGEAFSGVPHAESADCPRCGTIARQRFHLHALGLDATGRRPRVLEVAPRESGRYGRAMRRWYRYEVLDPVGATGPLGHLDGLRDLPAGSADHLLSAHDLQTVPDPDAGLAELARILAPGGELLLQVPLLTGTTTALAVPDRAAPGTARWSFGVDLGDRLAAAGLVTDLLVTEELAALATGDRTAWAKAPGSGEVEVDALLGALADAKLEVVADRRTSRRCGWLPGVLFVTFRGRRPEGAAP